MMKKIDTAIRKTCEFIDGISQYLLIVLMAILVANMIARPVYKPFVWVYDAASVLAVGIISLCLPLCYLKGGLVRITLLTDKFPKVVQLVVLLIGDLMGLGTMAFVMWCEWKYMLRIFSQGITTTTVHIPYWPFAVCMVIGFTLFFVALLFDFVKRATRK